MLNNDETINKFVIVKTFHQSMPDAPTVSMYAYANDRCADERINVADTDAWTLETRLANNGYTSRAESHIFDNSIIVSVSVWEQTNT